MVCKLISVFGIYIDLIKANKNYFRRVDLVGPNIYVYIWKHL